MGKKRYVNQRDNEGDELTLSQEAVANGKRLASQVRKVLESETDKEDLDLLEYDIFAIVYAMMDMPNVASLWAKACDEYVVAAYQLAHELAKGLQEIEEKKATGTKLKGATTFGLIQPELTNTLIDQKDIVQKPLVMNVPTPIAIYKAQVEPTTKLYLYHLLGNDKVELTGNKEEYWNNHLDTLQRIYDSESDEDDNEDTISQTSLSQLYSSDEEMEVEKINPIFSNDLEEEIVFEEIERVPLHLNEFDDYHDVIDEIDLVEDDEPGVSSKTEETNKKRKNKPNETLQNESKAPLSKPWATLECHNIDANHVEAKRRKLTKPQKGKSQAARKGSQNQRVALRAAENVINEIAKGTRKRPGKTTQVQVLEDEEPEPDIQEEAHAEQEGLDSDNEIQFDGPQEHPNPFQVENENGEFDNFDEMLNKKTEKNLKKLLKGKEDTIEASKNMFQQIAAWHSKMSQMLKSSLGELNVRKHEIEILQKLDTKPSDFIDKTQSLVPFGESAQASQSTGELKKASFQQISAGKSKFEVSRLFVTTLMMINAGNVDIVGVESEISNVTTCPVVKNFELSLRSNVLQHTEINELMKQTIQSNKKPSGNSKKSKQSSDSSNPHRKKSKV